MKCGGGGGSGIRSRFYRGLGVMNATSPRRDVGHPDRWMVYTGPLVIRTRTFEKERRHEQSSGSGGDEEGRICAGVGWKAGQVGDQRAAFCWVGDLPHEGLAGESGPDLCVADFGMVWAGDAAVGRRRQDVGAGGEQVCLRRRDGYAPVV